MKFLRNQVPSFTRQSFLIDTDNRKMYKEILVTLTLCVMLEIRFGRSEVYNLHRRKVIEDRQELQKLGELQKLVYICDTINNFI